MLAHVGCSGWRGSAARLALRLGTRSRSNHLQLRRKRLWRFRVLASAGVCRAICLLFARLAVPPRSTHFYGCLSLCHSERSGRMAAKSRNLNASGIDPQVHVGASIARPCRSQWLARGCDGAASNRVASCGYTSASNQLRRNPCPKAQAKTPPTVLLP